jgi:1-acyl-sn-glycerol-3-phosphate acyltransferase
MTAARWSGQLRSLLFNAAFWAISISHTLWAALAALRPGAEPVQRAVRRYVHAMTWAMRCFAGIEIEVRGRDRLPQGDFIVAPKHSSYGDGFSIYNEVDDLVFVTGDHLERFPLMKRVLSKLGAIVLRTCAGVEARHALTAAARVPGRRILIYPEGHLAPVGVRFRYRSGVYHLARDLELPVVPVASSLGLFWPQERWTKRPGRAVLEFLAPITAGEDKAVFLAALTTAVEDRTAELIAEARGGAPMRSVRGEPNSSRPRRERVRRGWRRWSAAER